MSESATVHATLAFERMIPAPCNQVFAAYADVDKRKKWGAPSDNTALIYDQADFREGGEDAFRCGSRSNPNIHGATRYLDVVANRRIVSTETVSVDGRRLCVSLSTLEFNPDGDHTKLKSTIQGTRERHERVPRQSCQLLFEPERPLTQVHPMARLPHA